MVMRFVVCHSYSTNTEFEISSINSATTRRRCITVLPTYGIHTAFRFCAFGFGHHDDLKFRYMHSIMINILIPCVKLICLQLNLFIESINVSWDTWFRNVSSIVAGFNLQASPSTCIGIVFFVTILAFLHWVMHVPWPPT